MKLFVADAKYRAINLAYDSRSSHHGLRQISVTTESFGVGRDDTEALVGTKNDAWIQTTYAELRNDGTAVYNSNRLRGYASTKAAHHCREQNISGVGQLDLPNLYELIILYLESDNIDALDPTAESNRDKALGMMNTYGRFDFDNNSIVWSSTGCNSDDAWAIGFSGHALNKIQSSRGGVVPVKELTA